MADKIETAPFDEFNNSVACLISAMREVGRLPGGCRNDSNDEWWAQDFLAVERGLVERGLLLPRAEWEAVMKQEATGHE